jgi:hypothetical protein
MNLTTIDQTELEDYAQHLEELIREQEQLK